MSDDAPLTWIDPDTGQVELPLHLSLEWFDKMRQGVVGVVTLQPSGEGGWTFVIQAGQGMIDVAVVEHERRKAEGEGQDDA